eukprot:XP_011681447.1 PREDICTED: uncharacterized protein LOC105446390 [Strongylocentrotus purpuratus]
MRTKFRIIVVLFIFSMGITLEEGGVVNKKVNDPYIGRCLSQHKTCHHQAACIPDEFDPLKYECKCANGWFGDGNVGCSPPTVLLSVAPGIECTHSTLNTCFMTSQVGNEVRMSVVPHGRVSDTTWEITWYKFYAGLPPLYHSFLERLEREDSLSGRMQFEVSNSVLKLYEIEENDIYPNRFIAEIALNDSHIDTLPKRDPFDISEEESLNPTVMRVYFMIEQEPIEIGPISLLGPEYIDLDDHLPPSLTDIDYFLPHYRWVIEGDVEALGRRDHFIPSESEKYLSLHHLDTDELNGVVRGMAYGKNGRIPGRVLLASVRFRLKEDRSRVCSGPLSERVCTCRIGYTLAGTQCVDVDECSSLIATCLPKALCVNTDGSFHCQCPEGYYGDGMTSCSDIDECMTNDTCHPILAHCSNTQGSFVCTCAEGYVGDGFDCSAVSSWTEWTPWSGCAHSCGESTRVHTRDCTHPESGMICYGAPYEVEDCIDSPPCPVHGGWSEWALWTSCSASCDGQRQRVRMCDNPTPELGGRFCDGDLFTIDMCGNLTCPVPGDWGSWDAWSECSKACDGSQTRYRRCEPRRTLDRPDAVGPGLCLTGNDKVTRTCFLEENAEFCNHGYTKKVVTSPEWSAWSMWNE